jgi:hypothetical protein
MDSGRRLYLAYGSNLSRAQMAARCPQALPVAAVTIHGWRLGFFGEQTTRWGRGGVASLVADAAAQSYGALYELNAADEVRMDGFEGAPMFYAKREDFARCVTGTALTSADVVFCYLMNDISLPNAPSRKYITTIRDGYRDWALPAEAITGIETQP